MFTECHHFKDELLNSVVNEVIFKFQILSNYVNGSDQSYQNNGLHNAEFPDKLTTEGSIIFNVLEI